MHMVDQSHDIEQSIDASMASAASAEASQGRTKVICGALNAFLAPGTQVLSHYRRSRARWDTANGHDAGYLPEGLEIDALNSTWTLSGSCTYKKPMMGSGTPSLQIIIKDGGGTPVIAFPVTTEIPESFWWGSHSSQGRFGMTLESEGLKAIEAEAIQLFPHFSGDVGLSGQLGHGVVTHLELRFSTEDDVTGTSYSFVDKVCVGECEQK